MVGCPRATRVLRREPRLICMAPAHHTVAVVSAALQMVSKLGVDGAVVQELHVVGDSARARSAARFLEVPAAPVARPCDSWSQGAALWL